MIARYVNGCLSAACGPVPDDFWWWIGGGCILAVILFVVIVWLIDKL